MSITTIIFAEVLHPMHPMPMDPMPTVMDGMIVSTCQTVVVAS